MIPIRISVEGFMSFRDRTDLFFEGASLWALSGNNGVGKSAIFDAMRFALYGKRRGDKTQDAVELINQQRDHFLVEFEFAIGEDVYMVKRTVPRSKTQRSTFQAFYVDGPNSPFPNRPGPHAIPETDSSTGLKAWVLKTVGLDDRTFTSAVMLNQGKSDQLLEATAPERHEMLKEIVDLSAYETL